MNFLLNMNIRREMIAPLQERGHICRHVGDIGMSRAKDVEIVAEAKKTGETILTHDLDYGNLLAFSGDNAPSVIILRLRDLRSDEISSRLDVVWSEIELPLRNGAIVSISDRSLRIRNLPIEVE
ncbi:MAG: hypothetical protein B6D38_10860 [Anaerolineae bacterium UTCFX1]|jgi:predicted nuclease of predicted toxin-antitoxin system|nr:MAG: hypothetical protein B6D38_10860 [Anaerolineae bacterium UTCFX1]